MYRTILICAAIAWLGCGCRSPEKRVDRQLSGLRVEWQTNLTHQLDLPQRALDWTSALAELQTNNLKLRQARIEITNAQETVRQIFRDLLPTLNLRSGVSRTVRNFSTTTFDDVTFSADSFLNIPGFVTFASRLFAARLALLRAQTAYELTEREQVIALYKLFLQAQENALEESQLNRQKATARAMQQIDAFSGKLMLTELETKELTRASSVQSFQNQVGETIGNRAAFWLLTTNGLPQLRYDQEPLPLHDTNRVAQLQLRLAAIELEGARAQLTGIKLRYWPELNIFVTGPPLYQRGFGQERFWDAADIRASADLFWSIDTRGYVSRQLRQTKRAQQLQRERLRQEMTARVNQLIFTQSLLHASQLQVRQVENQLQLLLAVPPAQNYDAIQKYANEYRTLVLQQQKLRRELAELNTLFWFVDEYAWNRTP